MIRKMTLKHAVEVAGKVQQGNSKIVGSTYNLPTDLCKTGQKLAKVPNSVCASCYATKIEKGIHGKTVLASEWKNYNKWLECDRSEWVHAIAKQIENHSRLKQKNGKAGAGLHRWFSSGDLQGMAMLKAIVEVCNLTPNVKHWLPTKEKGLVNQYLRTVGQFPENLNVRLSDPMIDGSQVIATDKHITRSAVQKNSELIGHKCPVTMDKARKSCGDCNACWDKSVSYIVYKAH